MLNIRWKWNVPNVLSLLRLALIPCFAALYFCGQEIWAFITLLISGVTDCLDGYIARRFGQITDCGKLLDPLADKLTQVAVVVCLTTTYPELLPLAIICAVKELCQGIGGLILLRSRCEVRGAKWFGKMSTVVFYVCMLALVLGQDRLPQWASWGLIVLASVTTLWAFFGYMRIFIRIFRGEKAPLATPEQEKG